MICPKCHGEGEYGISPAIGLGKDGAELSFVGPNGGSPFTVGLGGNGLMPAYRLSHCDVCGGSGEVFDEEKQDTCPSCTYIIEEESVVPYSFFAKFFS